MGESSKIACKENVAFLCEHLGGAGAVGELAGVTASFVEEMADPENYRGVAVTVCTKLEDGLNLPRGIMRVAGAVECRLKGKAQSTASTENTKTQSKTVQPVDPSQPLPIARAQAALTCLHALAEEHPGSASWVEEARDVIHELLESLSYPGDLSENLEALEAYSRFVPSETLAPEDQQEVAELRSKLQAAIARPSLN